MQTRRPRKIQPTIVVAIDPATNSNSVARNWVVDTFATTVHPCTAFVPTVANVVVSFPIEWPIRLRFRAASNGPSLGRETIAMDCEDAAPEA